MTEKEIRIQKAILHILDDTAGTAFLSQEILALEDIGEYIQKHVAKALKDPELKELPYPETEDELARALYGYTGGKDNFIELSHKIANLFYEMICKYTIPAADLLVVDGFVDERPLLMVLKLNYKKSYIHYLQQDEGLYNKIICQPVSLPNESQKIDEFFCFCRKTGTIILKEKKYELDGNLDHYIAQYILNIPTIPSDKEQLHKVKKTVEAVADKYFPQDFTVIAEAEKVIYDTFEEEGVLDIAAVADHISKGVTSIKEEFIQEVQAKGIEETRVPLNENLRVNVSKKHRIVTDNGLELKLPVGFLEQKDKIEIINNPDGTLSILIKNIEII